MSYSNLKIALISDALTQSCLGDECVVRNVTPANHQEVIGQWRPDMLFVESAWFGFESSWEHRIASYKEPWRSNRKLRRVVEYAKNAGVPTVFWNKEDCVHFQRFISSAAFFDYIFTVDEKCVEKYKTQLGGDVVVNTLMFPIQPAIHNFSGFNFKYNRANFVGSYSQHIHNRRREWQDAMFRAASDLGVTVFDRNSNRKHKNYRYPELSYLEVFSAVPHDATGQIYKDYLVSLNVNTIEDSDTMYSRRLVEILACGGVAVTNPTRAVDRLFADYCHVVHDEEDMGELFSRLRHGPSDDDLMRARAGSECVLAEHTWGHRLKEVADVLGL